MRRCLYLVPLLLCLAPSPALAGGIPLFPEGWLPATVVISVTILLEGVLLRWRIKQVRFLDTLWRSGILNVASRGTGWLLLLGLAQCSSFGGEGSIVVVLAAFFFVNVLTEVPLLRLLYRQVPVTWERAWALGFGVNLASYAVACLLYPIVWIAYQGHLDEVELTNWKDPELLSRASGRIYALEADRKNPRLRVFDLREGVWHSLPDCPLLDPFEWDVKGQVCAYFPWKDGGDRKLAIASLPRFDTLREINVSAFTREEFGEWKAVQDLSISPDGRKIAFLFWFSRVAAYRDGSSYYVLDDKCKLVVLDIESGKLIAQADRWASDAGLCWLPDSDTVLFVSYRDETLYNTTEDDVPRGVGYGVRGRGISKFACGLYAFNTVTGEITWFAEGDFPSACAMGSRILVWNEEMIRILDTQGRERARLDSDRPKYPRAALSPSGRFVLAEFARRRVLLKYGGLLTVVDLDNPTRRHLLDVTWAAYPRLDWEAAEPPND
ncbi:MAG TPA: hypothetical protein VM238_16950 [Phycisphaerae bacterium]|nr:hypothetical protein [Phycisphaerae bacterium]